MLEGNDWSPLIVAAGNVNWTAVIAALITGSAAACGPMLLWSRQVVKERKGVRAALLAEVSVLVELIQYRAYLPTLRDSQSKLIAIQSTQGIFGDGPKPIIFKVQIDENYNRVFQGNIGKLGSLPADEAAQIVRFYQYVDAFKIDVSETGGLGKGSKRHQDFKEAGDLLQKLLDLGLALTEPRKKRILDFWR